MDIVAETVADLEVKDLKVRGFLTAYEDMPSGIADTVKSILMDSILALIAGMLALPQQELNQINSLLPDDKTPCRPVWPDGKATSLDMAGFVNGYCIRYADWGDAQRMKIGRGGHPSDMVAAALALSDVPGVSGMRILEIVNLGYHLWTVLRSRMLYKRPDLDATTTLALTIPVMAAVCFGDDPENVQNALNLSAAGGTVLCQVRPPDITNLKSGATGYAIARAFWCYRMSRFLKAPESMFTGTKGWYKAVAPMDGVLESLGNDAVYSSIQIKAVPCCNVIQAPAECAIRLHSRLNGNLNKITKINIHISQSDAAIAIKPDEPTYPCDHPSADHHTRYCVAVALKYGSLTPNHFAEEFLREEALRRLIDISEMHILNDAEYSQLGGVAGVCKLEIMMDEDTVYTECGRPTGLFPGLKDPERAVQFRRAVELKREMISRSYGFDFSSVAEIVYNFEKYSGQKLIDTLRESLVR